jgi:hypothetical protein
MLAIELLHPYSNGDLRLEDGVFLQATRLVGHGLEVRGSGGLAGCRRCAHRFQVRLGAALVVPTRAYYFARPPRRVCVSHTGSVLTINRDDSACLHFIVQTLRLGGHCFQALGSGWFIDRRRAQRFQVCLCVALIVTARAFDLALVASGVGVLHTGPVLTFDRDDSADLR